jgi:hypothetical protein
MSESEVFESLTAWSDRGKRWRGDLCRPLEVIGELGVAHPDDSPPQPVTGAGELARLDQLVDQGDRDFELLGDFSDVQGNTSQEQGDDPGIRGSSPKRIHDRRLMDGMAR